MCKQIIFIDKLQKNLVNDFYNINSSFEEFSIVKKKIDCHKEIGVLLNPLGEQKNFFASYAANYSLVPCKPRFLEIVSISAWNG